MATKHVYLTLAEVGGEPKEDATLEAAMDRRRIRLTPDLMIGDPAWVFPADANVHLLDRNTIVHAYWEV